MRILILVLCLLPLSLLAQTGSGTYIEPDDSRRAIIADFIVHDSGQPGSGYISGVDSIFLEPIPEEERYLWVQRSIIARYTKVDSEGKEEYRTRRILVWVRLYGYGSGVPADVATGSTPPE